MLPDVAVTLGGVFLMIAAGFVMRRHRWIGDGADATLLKLLVRVFVPALIVTRVLGNEALEDPRNILWPPALAFALVTFGIGLAYLVGRLFRRQIGDDRAVRTFALCTGMFNYGYITIPLVASVFEPTGTTTGVLFVFNLGVEAAMWGVGVTVLAGSLARGWWKRLFSPPVIATLVALMVNVADLWLGISDRLPAVATGGLESVGLSLGWLGDAAIPLGLLLTGSTIADDWAQCQLRKGVATVTLSSVMRLAVLPLAFIALAMTLPLTIELKRVLVLQAAMPAAVFPIVLSRHYGGDVRVALRVVVGTSLLALATMPLWVTLGLWLVG